MRIRELIQSEMEKRGLSIREFAKLVDVSHPTISSILNGEQPSYDICKKLVPVLNLPLESILRAAGLLPPIPPDTEYAEEFLHLIRQLSPEEQEEILEFLRLKVERKEKQKTKSGRSREKPPAQMLLKGE